MADFFQLFGLERSFGLDEQALQSAYFRLQREHHPDRVKPEDRTKALLKAGEINEGYKTLKSPLLRAEYLLSLIGITVGSEKDSVKPSQELLIESMEMREALMEAEGADAVNALLQSAKAQQEQVIADFAVSYPSQPEGAAQLAIRLRYLYKFAEEAEARKKLLTQRKMG